MSPRRSPSPTKPSSGTAPTPTTTTTTTTNKNSNETSATTTTLILFLLLLICLFPSLFHLLWTAPLALLFPPTSTTTTTTDHKPLHPPAQTMWSQKQFTLPARARGSYLITDTVVKELPELRSYKVGLLNLFIQHTSCALSLNENWDEVRPFSFKLSNRVACLAPGGILVFVMT
jgi:hypothetical protein